MSPENHQNDDLHLLSTLLAKERSDELSDKVKIVLSSDLTLAEKIEQIKAIDIEEKKAPPPENQTVQESSDDIKKNQEETQEEPVKKESQNYLSRPKKKPETIIENEDYIIDTISSDAAAEVRSNRHKISHDRKMLKPLVSRRTFLQYFFSERRKIRNFARDTGIINFKTFGTRLVLNPMVLNSFPKNILKVAADLSKTLKPVLEQGWHYLDKRDYNLVVLLFKLCREISIIDFEKFNSKTVNLIDRMAAAELLFLILHYESGDIKQLRYAVDTVYNKDPSKHDQQKDTSVNIHKLLDKDQMRPSLYNFIIGLNILKSKSYLEMKDLQKSSLHLIDSHDYNCSPKVRDKIDDYLRKLEKGIKPYLEQEIEVMRLQAFIPTDGNSVVDYSILKHFYDSTLQTRRLSFDKNKENIIKFTLNMGYSFLINFKDILSEFVEVGKGDKISLFAQAIFGQDILRIEFNLGKLDKIQTILPKLPTSRYIFIKKSLTGAIESEANAVRVIDEISSTMVFIGKRLAHILRNALPGEHGSDNEIAFFSFDEQTYPIARENEQISSHGYLKGFTVKQALYEIAGICYQTGALVQHSEISELLAKEKKIHDEILQRTKLYKKIAHELIYKAFIEKYELPQ